MPTPTSCAGAAATSGIFHPSADPSGRSRLVLMMGPSAIASAPLPAPPKMRLAESVEWTLGEGE
jgi:hypothetical protein